MDQHDGTIGEICLPVLRLCLVLVKGSIDHQQIDCAVGKQAPFERTAGLKDQCLHFVASGAFTSHTPERAHARDPERERCLRPRHSRALPPWGTSEERQQALQGKGPGCLIAGCTQEATSLAGCCDTIFCARA